jgi:predicted transcriptional regulator
VHHDTVRTTISIDEQLLNDVQQIATARRQTVSQVIEECVRENLLRLREPFALRRFQAGGCQVGIDLDDNAALLDLTDERS